jgi:electron transfer flavoprotein beta subunit
MRICVILAGVLDPKWALPHGDWLQDPALLDGIARKLSPFDEAALEVALRLREVLPHATLAVYMPDGAGAAGLMRAVAAHKPEHVALLPVADAARWDPTAFAREIAAGLRAAGAGSLWLTGREFGDLDDGTFSAWLAREAGAPLVAMAEELRVDGDGTLRAVRTRSHVIEHVRVPVACVVTLTNARSNRLRHPLMKNVMLAKKLPIDTLSRQSSADARMTPVQCVAAAGVARKRRAPLDASAGLDAQLDAVLELLDSACPT